MELAREPKNEASRRVARVRSMSRAGQAVVVGDLLVILVCRVADAASGWRDGLCGPAARDDRARTWDGAVGMVGRPVYRQDGQRARRLARLLLVFPEIRGLQ